jgi:hypothetical protein
MSVPNWRKVDSYSVACPRVKCGSAKRMLCRNKRGNPIAKAHSERVKAALTAAEANAAEPKAVQQ